VIGRIQSDHIGYEYSEEYRKKTDVEVPQRPDLIRRDDGHYNLGQSIYLVVRGGSGAVRVSVPHQQEAAGEDSWQRSRPRCDDHNSGARCASRGMAWAPQCNARIATAEPEGEHFGAVASAYMTWRTTRAGGMTGHGELPVPIHKVRRADCQQPVESDKPQWPCEYIAADMGTSGQWRGQPAPPTHREHFHVEGYRAEPGSWDRLQKLLYKKPGQTTHRAAMPWKDVPAFYAGLALQFIILTGMRRHEVVDVQ